MAAQSWEYRQASVHVAAAPEHVEAEVGPLPVLRGMPLLGPYRDELPPVTKWKRPLSSAEMREAALDQARRDWHEMLNSLGADGWELVSERYRALPHPNGRNWSASVEGTLKRLRGDAASPSAAD